MPEVTIDWYIALSTILFTIGAIGVLVRRNAIIIFMSIEMMLNAAIWPLSLLLAIWAIWTDRSLFSS